MIYYPILNLKSSIKNKLIFELPIEFGIDLLSTYPYFAKLSVVLVLFKFEPLKK